MGWRIFLARRKRTITGYALTALFFWLAWNAYIAAQYIDTDGEILGESIYLSSGELRDSELANSIDRDVKRMEYLFWSQELRNLNRGLSTHLRQRINHNPFNGQLWVQLSYLQKDNGVSLADRAWTIARAARVSNWNFDQRSEISHHCIVDYSEFLALNPDLCSTMLNNLPPNWPEHAIAGKSNVKIADLRAVLELERVRRKQGTSP